MYAISYKVKRSRSGSGTGFATLVINHHDKKVHNVYYVIDANNVHQVIDVHNFEDAHCITDVYNVSSPFQIMITVMVIEGKLGVLGTFILLLAGMCGFCCYPCQIYSNADKLGESGILCALLG